MKITQMHQEVPVKKLRRNGKRTRSQQKITLKTPKKEQKFQPERTIRLNLARNVPLHFFVDKKIRVKFAEKIIETSV